jgi:hypothetical protein
MTVWEADISAHDRAMTIGKNRGIMCNYRIAAIL